MSALVSFEMENIELYLVNFYASVVITEEHEGVYIWQNLSHISRTDEMKITNRMQFRNS